LQNVTLVPYGGSLKCVLQGYLFLLLLQACHYFKGIDCGQKMEDLPIQSSPLPAKVLSFVGKKINYTAPRGCIPIHIKSSQS